MAFTISKISSPWRNWALTIACFSLTASAPTFLQEAVAQTPARCDSSVKLSKCVATAQKQGNFIKIETDTEQCAMVDWSFGGYNQLTTVTDGEEMIETLQSSNASPTVNSCTVIKDNNLGRMPASQRGGSEANGTVKDPPQCKEIDNGLFELADQMRSHNRTARITFSSDAEQCRIGKPFVQKSIAIQKQMAMMSERHIQLCPSERESMGKTLGGVREEIATLERIYEEFSVRCSSQGF